MTKLIRTIAAVLNAPVEHESAADMEAKSQTMI